MGTPHVEDPDNQMGKNGVQTMAQRLAIMQKLRATPTTRPRVALFEVRRDPAIKDQGISLQTMQNLKKNTMSSRAAHRQDIGDLAQAVCPHVAVPSDPFKAYFAVH